jgi:hypothetical protein
MLMQVGKDGPMHGSQVKEEEVKSSPASEVSSNLFSSHPLAAVSSIAQGGKRSWPGSGKSKLDAATPFVVEQEQHR